MTNTPKNRVGHAVSRVTEALDSIRWGRKALDQAEDRITRAVVTARREGASWAAIGQALGVSPQAAHRKYRQAVRSALWP